MHRTKGPSDDRKKLKKKTKFDDQAYRDKQHKKSHTHNPKSEENLFAIRTITAPTVTDSSGQEVPFITGILINKDMLSTPLKSQNAELTKSLDERFSKTKHVRPIGEITELSAMNSPLAGTTPVTKTKVVRVAKLGVLSVFSNQAPSQTPTIKLKDTKVAEEFYSSEQYKAVKKIFKEFKLQELTISSSLIKKTKKEKQQNGSHRSQNKVMAEQGINAKKANASDYVTVVLGIITGFRAEWIHLVPNKILGKESQHEDNIGACTVETNTWMMFIERTLPTLAEKNPEGFPLKITAKLIPGTHVVKSICYEFCGLTLELDPENLSKPHISMAPMIGITIDELTSHKDRTIEKTEASSSSSIYFYSKSIPTEEKTDTVEPKPSLSPKK